MYERVQIYRGFRPDVQAADSQRKIPNLKVPSSQVKSFRSLTEWKALVTMFLEDEGDDCVDAYLRMANYE